MILAFEVLGYFAAQEAAGDGMAGVAAEPGTRAVFVDVDEQGAGVRAIQSADGLTDLSSHMDDSNLLKAGRLATIVKVC